jgi:acetyl-CoA carboxylase biotin carboxyl carrier protein
MTDDLAHDPNHDASGTPATGEPPPAAEPLPTVELLPAAGSPPLADPSLPAADASLLALVDRLAALLERSDLLELEVESGGTGIVLRKAAALAALPPTSGPGAAQAADPGAASPAAERSSAASSAREPTNPARAAVLAPLTGIFYASPSPGSPPFVAVGREVVAGQVIGLIEAMKLFNEIKSDKSGRVVRVVAENGTLVKAKHPLIEVEPL